MIARVKIGKPEYEYHRSRSGKKLWKLNGHEIKMVINALNSKSEYIDGTVWDDIIIRCKNSPNRYNLDNIQMPDYSHIDFDKKRGNKFK